MEEDKIHEIATDLVCNEDWWYEDVFEEFIEELEEVGIHNLEGNIRFSGFWSQGDGASFTSDYVDLHTFVLAHIKELEWEFVTSHGDIETAEMMRELGAEYTCLELDLLKEGSLEYSIIRTDSRNVHENSVSLDTYYNWSVGHNETDADRREYTNEDDIKITEFAEYLEGFFSNWLKNKCKELYGRLEKACTDAVESEKKRLLRSYNIKK